MISRCSALMHLISRGRTTRLLFQRRRTSMEIVDASHAREAAPEKKTLFVAFASGIPRYRAGHGVRKALVSMLKQNGCKKVRVDHNSEGHARGWAWLFFSTVELRDKCCELYCDGITLFIPPPANSGATAISYTLRVQACNNMKLSQTFPSLNSHLHTAIKLDPEAYFSISDEYSANDMTSACLTLLGCLCLTQRSGVAVDGTAGGGGNTASLIRSQRFQSIVAYEVHSERAADLVHNLNILFGTNSNYSVKNCSCVGDILEHRNSYRSPDLLFLDPPWGGTNYRSVLAENNGLVEYYLAHNNERVALSELLSDIVVTEECSGVFKLIAIKLPSEFDMTPLCRAITRPRNWWKETPSGDIVASTDSDLLDMRPHPFRLQTGARTSLLLVAYPPYFRNSHLDQLVASLATFDKQRGSEFHPKYYDWEKSKWISLRSWKGCKMHTVE